MEAAPKPEIAMDEYTDDEEQYENDFVESKKNIVNSTKRSPTKEIS